MRESLNRLAIGAASALLAIVLCGYRAECSGAEKVPFVNVPDPLSGENPLHPLVAKEVPQIGKPFSDARFGTTLTRVTQADGVKGRHEYSRHDPFNKDQTMIVLLPEGEWKVYRTNKAPYNQSENLVATLRDVAEPRWDVNDPDIIWCLQDFCIRTINVKTGHTTTVKDFKQDPAIAPIVKAEPDLYRVTTKDEGEPSLDKRFWALMLQGSEDDYRPRYIITWDRQENRLLALYKIPKEESKIDWVGMSSLGTWALVGGDWDNGGKLAGLTMADKELTKFQRLDYGTAHSDVGLDVNGKEVIVMQNGQTDFIDLIPLDPKTKPILEAGGSYDGTGRTSLVRLFYDNESPHGFNCGVHISCNVPGYCVISTHMEPNMKEQNWLDRTITLVKLNPIRPQVFYLAKVHNTTAAYWEETQATITNDGAKVVWASNWSQNVGKEQIFLMQLDMPKNWRDMLNVPK
ncbi:MAG: hypothetical protein AB1696_29100 [Planctomycetota bacterium]